MPGLVTTAHAYGVIAFTLLAFFLFTRARIPISVTSLFVVAGLALGFLQQVGAPPEPFILAAIVGCNLSFATPMGYQTNVLIMQPGGYVFRDFVRVGGPLVVLMIVAFSFQLARAYPI